jgi:energy-coupling factor transporter transmembrane protein EcfT
LALFLKTIFKKEKGEFSSTFSGTLWKRVLIVVIALIIYAVFMPKVGYLISTFLLMGFLFWVVKGTKWWLALVYSLLTTIITYYCFSVWLRLEFPEGLFRL